MRSAGIIGAVSRGSCLGNTGLVGQELADGVIQTCGQAGVLQVVANLFADPGVVPAGGVGGVGKPCVDEPFGFEGEAVEEPVQRIVGVEARDGNEAPWREVKVPSGRAGLEEGLFEGGGVEDGGEVGGLASRVRVVVVDGIRKESGSASCISFVGREVMEDQSASLWIP